MGSCNTCIGMGTRTCIGNLTQFYCKSDEYIALHMYLDCLQLTILQYYGLITVASSCRSNIEHNVIMICRSSEHIFCCDTVTVRNRVHWVHNMMQHMNGMEWKVTLE